MNYFSELANQRISLLTSSLTFARREKRDRERKREREKEKSRDSGSLHQILNSFIARCENRVVSRILLQRVHDFRIPQTDVKKPRQLRRRLQHVKHRVVVLRARRRRPDRFDQVLSRLSKTLIVLEKFSTVRVVRQAARKPNPGRSFRTARSGVRSVQFRLERSRVEEEEEERKLEEEEQMMSMRAHCCFKFLCVGKIRIF